MPTLDDSINEVKDFQQKLNEAAENADEVKEGKFTAEDEKAEPDFQVYNAIAETTIKILENEKIVNTFNKLSEKIGDELTKSIIEAISIAMTNSAFNAIIWYDALLERNIVPQINKSIEKVNLLDADMLGYSGAIRVLKEKVSIIEKKLTVDNVNK